MARARCRRLIVHLPNRREFSGVWVNGEMSIVQAGHCSGGPNTVITPASATAVHARPVACAVPAAFGGTVCFWLSWAGLVGGLSRRGLKWLRLAIGGGEALAPAGVAQRPAEFALGLGVGRTA
jgi:hypothetical protein